MGNDFNPMSHWYRLLFDDEYAQEVVHGPGTIPSFRIDTPRRQPFQLDEVYVLSTSQAEAKELFENNMKQTEGVAKAAFNQPGQIPLTFDEVAKIKAAIDDSFDAAIKKRPPSQFEELDRRAQIPLSEKIYDSIRQEIVQSMTEELDRPLFVNYPPDPVVWSTPLNEELLDLLVPERKPTFNAYSRHIPPAYDGVGMPGINIWRGEQRYDMWWESDLPIGPMMCEQSFILDTPEWTQITIYGKGSSCIFSIRQLNFKPFTLFQTTFYDPSVGKLTEEMLEDTFRQLREGSWTPNGPKPAPLSDEELREQLDRDQRRERFW
jgi:hypothetical protein